MNDESIAMMCRSAVNSGIAVRQHGKLPRFLNQNSIWQGGMSPIKRLPAHFQLVLPKRVVGPAGLLQFSKFYIEMGQAPAYLSCI